MLVHQLGSKDLGSPSALAAGCNAPYQYPALESLTSILMLLVEVLEAIKAQHRNLMRSERPRVAPNVVIATQLVGQTSVLSVEHLQENKDLIFGLCVELGIWLNTKTYGANSSNDEDI